MTDNSNPSLGDDPASSGNLAGMMRFVWRKFLQGTDGMLPAKVIAVSDDRMFVTVQPQVMIVGTNQQATDRAQIAKVPVIWLGGGNFVLSFPVKAGDFGWIHANDRDISLYLQSGKAAKPNTARLHSFEDAVFVPDKAREFTVAGEDADRAVWQSLDGAIKVALGADTIKVVHPTQVEFVTPLVKMSGDLTVEGTIRGKTDVLSGAGEISGKTHHHSGVTTGSGNSGGPAN